MTVAELRAVSKRFGRIVALDAVSLALAEGEVLALLGPNGAGKSTALAVLLGLRAPDAGAARVLGGDPRSARSRRALGVAPQETAFPPTLRVAELVDLVRAHFDRPVPGRLLAARFGLAPLARRQLGGLSAGERRRVAVALAFAGAPRLVVLDEPTTGLDGPGRRSVWEAIRAHASEGGTILLTTHQLDEAEALAGRVVLLDAGRVVDEGAVAEIKGRAGLARVAYRSGGRTVRLDVADAGAAVAELVRAGVVLEGLEVRPLTLAEALAARSRR